MDANGLENMKFIKDEWITSSDKSVSVNALRPLSTIGRNGTEVYKSVSKSLVITIKLSEHADVNIGSFRIISRESNVKEFTIKYKKEGEETFKQFGKVNNLFVGSSYFKLEQRIFFKLKFPSMENNF